MAPGKRIEAGAAVVGAVSIDTGVLVEFIDEAGDLHAEAEVVVESITSGRLRGLVPHPVLAELYYVSSRLYEREGGTGEGGNQSPPEARAEKLIRWLSGVPGIQVAESNAELAIKAGKIKRDYAFALTDSYVLAAAELYRCTPVFKAREEEMNRGGRLNRLAKAEKIDVVFLEDFGPSEGANALDRVAR